MSPRPDTLRRCAFKLPKNDKYQCQKAVEKHQSNVTLWYCKFHARHARDRCQALIEWAGKGAQCEQLGISNEKAGEILCDLHATRNRRDSWPQIQHVTSKKRKDVTNVEKLEKHDTEEQDTAKQRYSLVPSPSPALLAIEYQPKQYLCPVETDPLGSCSAKVEEVPIGLNTQAHAPQTTLAEKATLEDGTQRDNATLIPPISKLEDLAINTLAREANTAVAVLINVALPITEYDVTASATVRKPPGEHYSPEHSLHTCNPNVDDLVMLALRADEMPAAEPMSTYRPAGKGRVSNVPPVTVHANYKHIVQSFGTTEALHGNPEYRRLPHRRIDSLNPFQAQEVSSSAYIAAMYVQCCVCLEKHGQDHMHQVDPCKHQYRNLCLQKILKTGVMRQYNCMGCREWMDVTRREYESGER